jgi:hypothetical protein
MKPASTLPIHAAEDQHYRSWDCGPVGQTRDSDTLDRCNFEVAQERLSAVDPVGEDFAVLRFGHWAVGWVEEIVVRPGTPAHFAAREMERDLASYPILDEDRLSAFELEAHDDSACDSDCSYCAEDAERPGPGQCDGIDCDHEHDD